MSVNTIKYTCIFTLFILISYAILPIIPATMIFVSRAEAASADNDDIYKGILLALLLILISKIGQARDNAAEEGRGDLEDRIDYSNEDIDLLARISYAEARGEPFQGQVAVAAVVLNRVEYPDFPDTVRGVIHQSGQFSSVTDGQFYLTPNSTSYLAAREAINGSDPSLGALYFYNPDKAKYREWFLTREETTRIGQHVFLK
jgi:N-acetylmuramoyl-L-alanine amidase